MGLKVDYVFDDLKEIKDFKNIEHIMDDLIEEMYKIDSMNAPYMNYTNSKFVITRNAIQSLPPISILSYYKGIPIEICDVYAGCCGVIKLYFDLDMDKPKKTTYKRTGYDGSTKCPFCGRNFCFSTNLRNTAHIYYAIGKSQPYTAYNKMCNFCGNEFSFYWDDSAHKYRYTKKGANTMPPKDGYTGTFYFDDFIGIDRGHGFIKAPHIDHVKFNGPATIVFWKDGTKTVVKHDGKGRKDKRQAILYAFIRKIYGEGKPYNNILNEIEEAIK